MFNAGDRILIQQQQRYATVKWIGIQQHRTLAALEFVCNTYADAESDL